MKKEAASPRKANEQKETKKSEEKEVPAKTRLATRRVSIRPKNVGATEGLEAEAENIVPRDYLNPKENLMDFKLWIVEANITKVLI